MGSKGKKVRAAALRDFLVAIPGALERVTASLGWLVVLAAIALAALLLHLLFGGGHPPPPPTEHPVAALYVRDLGRLPDARHTFDIVYDVALPESGERHGADFSIDRLALGDAAEGGDVAEMSHAPGLFDDPALRHAASGIAWRIVAQRAVVAGACGPGPHSAPHPLLAAVPVDCVGGLVGDHARSHQAHYRIIARVDQLADVAIGYGRRPPPHGWFGWHNDDDGMHETTALDEEVQLGAVLRAHCALGVKVQHGEVRSLCGS